MSNNNIDKEKKSGAIVNPYMISEITSDTFFFFHQKVSKIITYKQFLSITVCAIKPFD